jgi:iron complex transport system substrate-binding protein
VQGKRRNHGSIRFGRARMLLVLVAACALVATACGDDGGSGVATEEEPGAASGVFPMSVEHALGTTEVPERPERVVSVGYNDQDPILALGVVPVGVMPWYDDDPIGFSWTIEAYGDALPETVGTSEFLVINYEKVAALEPDLIIGVSGLTEEAYATLSKIAPTIAQAPGEGDYSSASWQTNQRLVGAALGLADEAEQVIAEVEAVIEGVRADHPEFAGSTAIVAQVYEGQYAVRGSNEIWSEFLAELGFTIPTDIATPDYADVSAEYLERFADLDALVWLAQPDEIDSPIYPSLAVATEGRDVYVEALGELSGAIGYNSALSLPVVIEQLVPKLAAAVDGDPATVVPS